MINILLPSKRPILELPNYTKQPSKKTLFEEAQRRDLIVRNIAAKLTYGPGDWVTPNKPESVNEYGDRVKILRICDTYGKFGKDEVWPESDNPMIVHAWSEKLDTTFMCTANFLVKK
jgi:hypothetical protein